MIKRQAKSSAKSAGPPVLREFDDFDSRLGDIMRGERATLGKSIQDVQNEIRIKADYISAIEDTNPDAFEVPGFIAGYVRSYARYLDIDPEWAYMAFCRDLEFSAAGGASAKEQRPDAAEGQPKSAGITKSQFARLKSPFTAQSGRGAFRVDSGAVSSSLILVVLISFIGYGGWEVLKQIRRTEFAAIQPTLGVGGAAGPLADADEAGGVNGNDPSSANADSLDRLYPPESLDAPILTARDEPISMLDPDEVSTVVELELASPDVRREVEPAPSDATGSGESNSDSSAGQVFSEGPPVIAMIAVQPAWVRVSDPDGAVIFEQILDAGEHYVLPRAEDAPSLHAGNPGSLYFSVGGQAYGPAGANASSVRDVILSADAITERYAAADLNLNLDLARVVAELPAAFADGPRLRPALLGSGE